MARKNSYSIIRFLITAFYLLAAVILAGGVGLAVYLAIQASALKNGVIVGGALADLLQRYNSSELYLGAVALAAIGLVGFLVFGAIGQILAMHRQRSIDASVQVQLLGDILELNEEVARSSHAARVDLCEGCGRLGSIQRIQSGQWVCRDCRRELRSV